MDVRSKVVIITGASRGIGAACADAFGRRGAKLSLASRSTIDREGALTTCADVTIPEDRERLIRRTLDHYGRIDILVNNAGSGMYGATADADPLQVTAMFTLNLLAPVALIQLVLPHMLSQNSGAIVNISSIAAEIALPWMTLYSASKAALRSAGSGLRRELKGTAIQITDVMPVYVTTNFQSAAIGRPPTKLLLSRRRAITPAQCGEYIVRGVERGARTVVAPPSGWFAIVAQRFFPSVIDSALSNMNR